MEKTPYELWRNRKVWSTVNNLRILFNVVITDFVDGQNSSLPSFLPSRLIIFYRAGVATNLTIGPAWA